MSKAFSATPIRKQTLAEQVAVQIKEAILDGTWEAGDALPAEPVLAEAYGVSRAVVRDATRMLAARGLVEAQHGRGVFVTASQTEAFGEALLLALRREGATVWDVEQFEQMVLPEVCALAAAEATPEDCAAVTDLARAYLDHYTALIHTYWNDPENAAWGECRALFFDYIATIFAATHNTLWALLAQPLYNLRNLRKWDVDPDLDSPETFVQRESRFINTLAEVICAGDPVQARATVREIMRLPAAAEQAMRGTRVGDIPNIPASGQG